jgi:UDP-2,4-diacetamido-2,4,6-trideoxy-beta-L-altropyranose hydrolase
MTKAVLFADGGAGVGLGHLRRTVQLMNALTYEGVGCRMFAPAGVQFSAPGLSLEAWNPDDDSRADFLVVDSYRLGADDVAALRKRFPMVVAIDDMADRNLLTDVVLNHNFHAATLDYSGWRARRTLLGPQWSLVDPGFSATRSRSKPPAPKRVLVSFGGVPTDHGEKLARTILRLSKTVVVDLVVPPQADPPSETSARLRVLRAPDMVEAMAQAHVYVGAAGVTALEAAAANVPMVVCALWDNQLPVIGALTAAGVPAFPQFMAEEMSQAALAEADRNGDSPVGSLFDGRGPQRAAVSILELVAHPARATARKC